MDIPGKLVIRVDTPVRRWLLRLLLLLLTAAALYAMFELGRFKAGFDGIRAAQQQSALEQQNADLERQMRELRVQLQAASDAQDAQVSERSELARTIGDLQAQLARSELDLQFYRGIATPQAGSGTVIRAQQFEVRTQDAEAGKYLLRFTLNRVTRGEDQISGNIGVTMDGQKDGAAASLDLGALTGGQQSQLAYGFRYYDNIEQAIAVPAGFAPSRVTLEIRPSRKGVSPYRQTFLWSPQAAL